MTSIREFQRQNVSRANQWHKGDFKLWSGLEWAGALCGEAGEAANVAKKLKRLEDGIRGNEFSENAARIQDGALRQALAAECADTLAYLVLLAARYDIDLESAAVEKFNRISEQMGLPERIAVDAPSEAESRETAQSHHMRQVDTFGYGAPLCNCNDCLYYRAHFANLEARP